MNNTSNDISALRIDINKLSQEVYELKPRLEKVEEEIDTLKNSVSALKMLLLLQACAEFSYRSIAGNAMLFFIMWLIVTFSMLVLKAHDRELISHFFSQIDFEPSSFSFFRLGKQFGSKPKPVKVMLPNSEVAREFFTKFSEDKLDGNTAEITVSKDRTPRVYRNDRSSVSSTKSSGGGVLIAASKHLQPV